MSGINVLFDDFKSFDDWGLKLEKVSLSFPEPKLDLIDVRGLNGLEDLTEVNGPVTYSNRTLRFRFSVVCDHLKWYLLSSQIAAAVHGKRLKCILPDDPTYYYEGRFTIEASKENAIVTGFEISGDVEPYKNEVQSSIDPWEWDTFSFVDGIIREYADIVINGSGSLTVIGRDKPVVPLIIASTAMTVEFAGETYELEPGNNKIYDIVMEKGENMLIFTGNGTVSVDYRGGIL